MITILLIISWVCLSWAGIIRDWTRSLDFETDDLIILIPGALIGNFYWIIFLIELLSPKNKIIVKQR